MGYASVSPAETASKVVGVSDPQRAKYNWVMQCQGCHGADGAGSDGGAPNMVGVVAAFLHFQEGREFLGRVPGVAFVSLPEKETAELLNWLVNEFDSGHLPRKFIPYTADEVKKLRLRPLISQATNERNKVMKIVSNKGGIMEVIVDGN